MNLDQARARLDRLRRLKERAEAAIYWATRQVVEIAQVQEAQQAAEQWAERRESVHAWSEAYPWQAAPGAGTHAFICCGRLGKPPEAILEIVHYRGEAYLNCIAGTAPPLAVSRWLAAQYGIPEVAKSLGPRQARQVHGPK